MELITFPRDNAEDGSIERQGLLSRDLEQAYSFIGHYFTGSGDVVAIARDFDKNIVLQASDGSVRVHSSFATELYEPTIYFDKANDLVYFMSIDSFQNIYIVGVNCLDNSQVFQRFLTKDIVPLSMVYDEFRNELIIWRHLLSQGSVGHSFIATFNITTQVLENRHEGSNLFPNDAFVHLTVDPTTGQYIRALHYTIGGGTTNAIQFLNLTVLDGSIYSDTVTGGVDLEVNFNTATPSFGFPLAYIQCVRNPLFGGDQVVFFVCRGGERHGTVYRQSPTTWDYVSFDGAVLDFQNEFGVQYDKYQIDSINFQASDVRTRRYARFNYDPNNLPTVPLLNEEIDDQYFICDGKNSTDDYYTSLIVDPTSEQENLKYFDNTSLISYINPFFTSNNSLYFLDFGACPIEDTTNVAYTFYDQGLRRDKTCLPEDLKPELSSTTELTGGIGSGTETLIYDEDFTFDSGRLFYLGVVILSLITDEYSRMFLKDVPNNSALFVRDNTTLVHYNKTTDSLSTLTVPAMGYIVHWLLFDNTIYLWNTSDLATGTSYSVYRVDFDGQDLSTAIFSETIYGSTNAEVIDMSRVRVFSNVFDGGLYLFDQNFPSEIRVLNSIPTFDVSSRGSILANSDLLIASDTTVGRNPVNNSTFTVDFISPVDVLYVDSFDGKAELINVLAGLTNGRGITFTSNPLSDLLPVIGTHLSVMGDYLQDKNLINILKVRPLQELAPTDNFGDYYGGNANGRDHNLYVDTDGILTNNKLSLNSPNDFIDTYQYLSSVDPNLFSFVDTTTDGDIALSFYSKTGDFSRSTFIDSKQIIKYERKENVDLTTEVFNNNTTVSTRGGRVYKTFNVEYLADDIQYREIVDIFESQWFYSVDSLVWNLQMYDQRYEIPVGTEIFRVAITGLKKKWISSNAWAINLELSEMSSQ